jgi:hypothetical protein
MTCVNIAIMAAVSHMCIWHWDDIKSALDVIDVRKLFRKGVNWKFWQHKATVITDEEAEAIDPHYRLMQAYEDVPGWWYGLLWVVSATLGFITSRIANSTLEWVRVCVFLLFLLQPAPPKSHLLLLTCVVVKTKLTFF